MYIVVHRGAKNRYFPHDRRTLFNGVSWGVGSPVTYCRLVLRTAYSNKKASDIYFMLYHLHFPLRTRVRNRRQGGASALVRRSMILYGYVRNTLFAVSDLPAPVRYSTHIMSRVRRSGRW